MDSTESIAIGDFEYSLTHRLAEDRPGTPVIARVFIKG
jgi:hypothetical protein